MTASNTTVNGMLGVTGATTVGGTLGVTGATTISSPLDVTGTFDVVGNSLLDGTLTVNGNVSMVADATVGGQAVFLNTFMATGTINIIGDEITDKLSIIARIDSDIIPETDNTYSLGSPSIMWQTVYTNSITTNNTAIGDVQIALTTNNTIDTSAGNLVIDSAGGTIQVNDNIEIQGSAKITDTLYLGNWTIQTNSNDDIMFSIGGSMKFKMDASGVFQSGSDVTI